MKNQVLKQKKGSKSMIKAWDIKIQDLKPVREEKDENFCPSHRARSCPQMQ